MSNENNCIKISADAMIKYAPAALVIISIAIQYNIFVTPAELQKTKENILENIKKEYATKEATENLGRQITDMQSKINQIYDYIMKNSK